MGNLRECRNLVVIPSESILLYERKGIDVWLERYFNPNAYFDKVYLLSPLEKLKSFKYGMHIIPIKSGRHYRELVRKINPICVRTYGAYWASSYGILNKVDSIPVICSIHDPNPQKIFKEIVYADYVLCMSEMLKAKMLERGISETRLCVTGNRINFNKFSDSTVSKEDVRKVRSQFPSGNFLLHVGRLCEQKNVNTTIKALKFLPDDFFLVLIGAGELPDNHIIESLKGRLYHFDKVSNDELPAWYSACDVFVVPSLWEGFGLVFLEAAACKTKIVTSDIAPINTFLVHDNSSVSLVKNYRDAKSISKAILNLLENCSAINHNYESIRSRFSIEAIEAKEIALYNSIKTDSLFKIDTIGSIKRVLKREKYFFKRKKMLCASKLKKWTSWSILRTRIINRLKLNYIA